MDSTRPREKSLIQKLFRSVLKFLVVVLCLTALGATAGLVIGVFADTMTGSILRGGGAGFVFGLVGAVGSVVYKDPSRAAHIPQSGADFGGGGDGGGGGC